MLRVINTARRITTNPTSFVDDRALLVNKFFPNGVRDGTICQRRPNCHLISALDALRNNQAGEKIIEEMISPLQGGGWQVTFLGCIGANKHIKVFPDEIGETRIDGKLYPPVNGDLGWKIIEAAYHKLKANKADNNIDPCMVLFNITGWEMLQCYPLWRPYYTFHRAQSSLDELFKKLDELGGAQAGNYVLIAITPPREFPRHDFMLRPDHSYSIRRIDTQNRTVVIVDPKDTSVEMEISYDKYSQEFCAVSGVKQMHSRVLRWMNRACNWMVDP